MDLAISATPIADRCITPSTQPCNLHRQRLAVEWPYWRVQWLSMWHRHMMTSFQQVSSDISSLLELPWSTVSVVIVQWKRIGATTAKLWIGRPHNPTERDQRLLKRIASKNQLFQSASGSNVSTRTVHSGASWNGFHGRAAAHKPTISMRSAKCRLEGCKARRHWTLEQMKRVLLITLHHLAGRRTNLGLADARRNATCPTA